MEQPQDTTLHITTLPLDALCHVFTFLTPAGLARMRQACKYFDLHRAQLYHDVCHLDFSPWRDKITSLHIQAITSFTPCLKTLDLTACYRLAPHLVLNNLLPTCHSSLHTLSLRSCTDVDLPSILVPFPQLLDLDLSYGKWVDNLSCVYLSTVFPNTQTLSIRSCFRLTDQGIRTICESLPKIDNLCIHGCWKLTNGSLQHVAKYLPGLTSLDIESMHRCTLTGINTLATCTKLTSLNLRECGIKDAALSVLGSSLPDLRVLNLKLNYLITNDGLKSVASPQLVHLDIQECPNINDYGLKIISACTALEYIDLRSCHEISDVGVEELTTHCTRLSTLQLKDCAKITNKSLWSIAQLPNLSVLNVQSCKELTDDGFAAFKHHRCSRLTVLNLGECTAVTDRAIKHIANIQLVSETQPRLIPRHLSEANAASFAPSLISLTVHGSQITDRGLRRYILRKCVNLYSLNLRNCTNLSLVNSSQALAVQSARRGRAATTTLANTLDNNNDGNMPALVPDSTPVVGLWLPRNKRKQPHASNEDTPTTSTAPAATNGSTTDYPTMTTTTTTTTATTTNTKADSDYETNQAEPDYTAGSVARLQAEVDAWNAEIHAALPRLSRVSVSSFSLRKVTFTT
eukprot:TRINITY_DN7496_c0_g1_i1.p1 TRINITY_DN7496_c0_g1~~TRINITY_DN7496_c0_g1_i1.p1  ORF type:complete len:630 (-),score=41.42 TRINITY_DN7496_c0_g1_i1:3-1892(-)